MGRASKGEQVWTWCRQGVIRKLGLLNHNDWGRGGGGGDGKRGSCGADYEGSCRFLKSIRLWLWGVKLFDGFDQKSDIIWLLKGSFWGFSSGPVVESPSCHAGDASVISGPENPMYSGAAKPVWHNYWACTPITHAPQQDEPLWWDARAPQCRVSPALCN